MAAHFGVGSVLTGMVYGGGAGLVGTRQGRVFFNMRSQSLAAPRPALKRKLPTELWTIVIETVPDIGTIYSCLLVCKAWLRPALRNLIRDIVVDGVSNQKSNTRRAPLPGSMRMTTFISIFGDLKPILEGDSGSDQQINDQAPRRQELTFRGAQARLCVRSLNVGDFTDLMSTETTFIDTLALFGNARVQSLSLRYCSAPYAERELFTACSAFATNITHLSIQWSFDSVVCLAEYVAEYPNLQTLVLACSIFYELYPDEIPVILQQSCDVHFELPSTDNVLTRWIAHDMSSLTGIWADTEETTSEVLRALCIQDPTVLPRVKSLYFLIEGSDPKSHIAWESLQDRLEQCTSLEQLTFRLRYGSHDTVTMLIKRFNTVFRGFRPTVQQISFQGDGIGSPHTGWSTLGTILRQRFPLLKQMPHPISHRSSPPISRSVNVSLLDEDDEDEFSDGPIGPLFDLPMLSAMSGVKITSQTTFEDETKLSDAVTEPSASQTTDSQLSFVSADLPATYPGSSQDDCAPCSKLPSDPFL
ncbi:hypothetical protein BKA62DRAFT_767878 [Auriculariales sp. MPI-PUGE-AT-0066]|nr:hypothetical protein BKA62DRAFT_767878 [Auriculariales sp. MPI-PUGE-AT-0066]